MMLAEALLEIPRLDPQHPLLVVNIDTGTDTNDLGQLLVVAHPVAYRRNAARLRSNAPVPRTNSNIRSATSLISNCASGCRRSLRKCTNERKLNDTSIVN